MNKIFFKKNKELIIISSILIISFIIYKLIFGGFLFLKWEIDARLHPIKDLSSVKLALERTIDKFPGKFTQNIVWDIDKKDEYNNFNENFTFSLWDNNFYDYSLDKEKYKPFILTKNANVYMTDTSHRFEKAFHFEGGHFTYNKITIGGHVAYDSGDGQSSDIGSHFLYKNLHIYLVFPRDEKENVDIFWTEFDKQLNEILNNPPSGIVNKTNMLNARGEKVDKFVKAIFKNTQTGEIFEYIEKDSQDEEGRKFKIGDKSFNAVNNCINVCNIIYFSKENKDVTVKALFNSRDNPVEGIITNVSIKDDEIIYNISSTMNNKNYNSISKGYVCNGIDHRSIPCVRSDLKIGDQVIASDPSSFLEFIYLADEVTKAELISYQYYTKPDTGEYFPVVTLTK